MIWLAGLGAFVGALNTSGITRKVLIGAAILCFCIAVYDGYRRGRT